MPHNFRIPSTKHAHFTVNRRLALFDFDPPPPPLVAFLTVLSLPTLAFRARRVTTMYRSTRTSRASGTPQLLALPKLFPSLTPITPHAPSRHPGSLRAPAFSHPHSSPLRVHCSLRVYIAIALYVHSAPLAPSHSSRPSHPYRPSCPHVPALSEICNSGFGLILQCNPSVHSTNSGL